MEAFVAKYLSRTALWCYRKPKRALLALSLSFLLSLAYGVSHLELQLAWTYLFESTDPVVVEFERARKKFPYPGDIAVLVDRGSQEERERFVQLVSDEMAKRPELFHHVFYRLDLSIFRTRALYFLDDELLSALHETLTDKGALARETMVSEPAVKLQLKLLEDLKQTLMSRGRSTLVPVWRVFAGEEGSRVMDSLIRLLNGEQYVYATIADNRVNVLVFKGGTRGAELKGGGREVVEARRLLERLKPSAYGLRVRLTGLPVMLYDERQTCAEDSLRSGLLSLVLISFVFFVGFGGVRKPLFSLAGLVCGLGWTLAYAAATVGHLNFITVTMMSMLLGLGIDFGIHLLFRFEEERESGCDGPESLERTIRTTGVDTLVGATATAASFLALTATDFRGVSDLGVLASGGVLLCFFSTVTVLPALLGLFPSQGTTRLFLRDSLADLEKNILSRSRLVVSLTFVLLLVGLYLASGVEFSYNLLKIQDQSLTSVQTEQAMLREYNSTVLSGAVLVKGEEKARDTAARLKELPTVANVGSVTELLPLTTPGKQQLISQIVVATERLQVPSPIALDRARDLMELQDRLDEIERASEGVARDPTVTAALDEVKTMVADLAPGPLQDGLKSFQKSILKDFTRLLTLLKSQQSEPIRPEDLPEEVRVRYLSPEGDYLLAVQPGVDIWKRDNLRTFLAEVESTGVTLVGHPVVQAHILESFDEAFQVTPFYTLLGVMLVMTLYLRRPGQILLSSLPTALGVVFMFGAMKVLGVQFNVVNFVALPISVGIGAVYGVHAVHRIQESQSVELLATSTGYGIVLSGLTTMAGFASLMTAHHRGLSSLGLVISLGVAANLLVALVVLPAVFRTKDQTIL